MGRKGSRLLPFLRSALTDAKYRNLVYEDDIHLIFSITLPHKSKRLNREDEELFKDWYELNNKEYNFASSDYIDAKQAITASLARSDYFEKVSKSRDKLTYRILNDNEVKVKKEIKKEIKIESRVKKEVSYSDHALSPVESGYASRIDSPLSDNSIHPANNILVTSCGNELSEVSNTIKLGVNFQLNDATSLVKSEFSREVDSWLTNTSSEAPISGSDELLQPYTLDTSNLIHNNSFQDNANSTFNVYDEVPKSEAMDVSTLSVNDVSTSSANDVSTLSENDVSTFSVNDVSSLSVNTVPVADDMNDFFKDFCSPKSEAMDVSTSSVNAVTNVDDMDDCLKELCLSLELDAVHSIPGNGSVDKAENLASGYDAIDYTKSWESISLNVNEASKLWESSQVANNKGVTVTNSHFPAVSDEVFRASNSNSSNLQKEVSPSQDPDVPRIATDSREKTYCCKSICNFKKTKIMVLEPQFQSCDNSPLGEIYIAFEDTLIKEIKGFKTATKLKLMKDHLLVLEPCDD